MKTTLNRIRNYSPYIYAWKTLLKNLGKIKADDDILAITAILDANGLDDAVWCLRAVEGFEKEKRLYAVDCAREVQHSVTNKKIINAINISELHAYGKASANELAAAESAAWIIVGDATGYADWAAAESAAEDAAEAAWATRWAAARVSTDPTAIASMQKYQTQLLRKTCARIEN